MSKSCGFYSTRTPLKNVVESSWTVDNQEVIVSFKGQTFVCDATELQARAIILSATREMEEKKNPNGTSSDLESSINCFKSQIFGSPSLSIKTSLKSFLQKRKQRIEASTPYNQ